MHLWVFQQKMIRIGFRMRLRYLTLGREDMPSRVQWQGIEPSEAERGLQYQYSLLCLVPASYQNKLQNPAQVNSSQEKREQSHGERRDASSEQTYPITLKMLNFGLCSRSTLELAYWD